MNQAHVPNESAALTLTPKEVRNAPDAELEAMLAERLAEVRHGTATPAFESMDAFEAWDETQVAEVR